MALMRPEAPLQNDQENLAKPPGERPLVLVFGASGYIGTWLVPRLALEPLRIRAVSRDEQVLRARDWDQVELAGSRCA